MFKKLLAASAVALFAVGTQAAYVTGSVAANQDPTTFLDLTGMVHGGALYSGYALPDAAIPKNVLPPKETVGIWLAAGPTNVNNGGGDAIFSLDAGSSFVSFLWGSPDGYNSLLVTTTGGSQFFVAGDFSPFVVTGNQDYASYIGFTADPGLLITSLTFSSSSNAFEASNFSITTPIPEPETYALMLAGLGALVFVSRRRKA